MLSTHRGVGFLFSGNIHTDRLSALRTDFATIKSRDVEAVAGESFDYLSTVECEWRLLVQLN
jgi:hypothetical protein